jgi:3-methyladenine DNA glycosylase AlkD
MAQAGLVAAIRLALREAADPTLAPGMQAYMKSAMPYLGVRVPAVRALTRAAAKADPPQTTTELEAASRQLWFDAAFREERYAASALLGAPSVRALRSVALLPLYGELVVSGAWWDHTDELAHRVGELLVTDRDEVTTVLRGWTRDDDLWLRRISIIAQLGAKADTDIVLLTYVIETNLGDREFFVRKAIGWALREYARTDPDWVRAFVAAHPALSPLSVREALKHL